jgi:hypothetical protein
MACWATKFILKTISEIKNVTSFSLLLDSISVVAQNEQRQIIKYVNVTNRRGSIIQNLRHFIHGHENTDSDQYHKCFITYFLMGRIKNYRRPRP